MEIIKDYLTPNSYSRPQKSLGKIKGIVIHWVANPGSSAQGNRNFFENRKFGKTSYGSAHYIIEGEKVIQCLPNSELGYHVGSTTYTASALRNLSSYPNNCTIGIELTHPDPSGKPNDITYRTSVELTSKLLKENGLTEKDVWTHKQVVGWKPCHKYYVDNPNAWVQFISDVATELRGETVTIPTPQPTKSEDYVLVEAIGHGDKGAKVKTLQENLNKLGYNVGKADGIFGDKTDTQVEKFQKAKGLVADGLAGQKTLAAIEKAIKELATPKPEVKPVTKPASTGSTKQSVTPKPTSPAPVAPKKDELKYTRTLKVGMSGSDVKELQTALNKLKFNCGTPDGKYGAKTKDAVRRYQSVYLALEVDGIAGKNTFKSINKQLNK